MAAELDGTSETKLVDEVTNSIAGKVTGVDRVTIEALVLASYRRLAHQSRASGYLAVLVEREVLAQCRAQAPAAEPMAQELATHEPDRREVPWSVAEWASTLTYGLFGFAFGLAPLVIMVATGAGWGTIVCVGLPFFALIAGGTAVRIATAPR